MYESVLLAKKEVVVFKTGVIRLAPVARKLLSESYQEIVPVPLAVNVIVPSTQTVSPIKDGAFGTTLFIANGSDVDVPQ